MTTKTINMSATTNIFATFGMDSMNAELKARGLTEQTNEDVAAMLLATGCRSLDEFSATIVNLTDGKIDSDTLASHMTKAFPNHKIGDRHGSHYLSLARNGNLSGTIECRFKPAKATRKAKAAAAKGISLDVSTMTDEQRTALADALEATNPTLAASVRPVDATEE